VVPRATILQSARPILATAPRLAETSGA
jgi:hypothetical protein